MQGRQQIHHAISFMYIVFCFPYIGLQLVAAAQLPTRVRLNPAFIILHAIMGIGTGSIACQLHMGKLQSCGSSN